MRSRPRRTNVRPTPCVVRTHALLSNTCSIERLSDSPPLSVAPSRHRPDQPIDTTHRLTLPLEATHEHRHRLARLRPDPHRLPTRAARSLRGRRCGSRVEAGSSSSWRRWRWCSWPGFFLGSVAVGTDEAGQAPATEIVMVEPGQSLWSIASELTDRRRRPHHHARDRAAQRPRHRRALRGAEAPRAGQRRLTTQTPASRLDPGWRAGEDEGRAQLGPPLAASPGLVVAAHSASRWERGAAVRWRAAALSRGSSYAAAWDLRYPGPQVTVARVVRGADLRYPVTAGRTVREPVPARGWRPARSTRWTWSRRHLAGGWSADELRLRLEHGDGDGGSGDGHGAVDRAPVRLADDLELRGPGGVDAELEALRRSWRRCG